MKFLALSALLMLSAANAFAQEPANSYDSGVRIPVDETESPHANVSDVIVVYGHRRTDSFPMPYEAYREEPYVTLTLSNDFGSARYEYRREVFDLGNESSIEFYSTWAADPSERQVGAPTRNGRSGRYVCRRPTIWDLWGCFVF